MKSTLLVDEWFGLLYQDGKFVKVLSMNKIVQLIEDFMERSREDE